jgi:hypothetical protein
MVQAIQARKYVKDLEKRAREQGVVLGQLEVTDPEEKGKAGGEGEGEVAEDR